MKNLRCLIGLHKWSTWRYDKVIRKYYRYCLRVGCHKRQYGNIQKAVNEFINTVLIK